MESAAAKLRMVSFDTSGRALSLALMEGGAIVDSVLIEPEGADRQEAVSALIPSIDKMLAKNKWEKSDIEYLVVGIGPGSFTGVRIAVVTARTLAQALSLPLLGVDRFAVLNLHLQRLGKGDETRLILLDGGRNFVFAAAYDPSGVELLSPTMSAIEEIETVFSRQVLSGSGCRIFVEVKSDSDRFLESLAGQSDRVLEPFSVITEIAPLQAEIARQRIISCNFKSDKFAFEGVKPLYLRGASITMKGNASRASSN